MSSSKPRKEAGPTHFPGAIGTAVLHMWAAWYPDCNYRCLSLADPWLCNYYSSEQPIRFLFFQYPLQCVCDCGEIFWANHRLNGSLELTPAKSGLSSGCTGTIRYALPAWSLCGWPQVLQGAEVLLNPVVHTLTMWIRKLLKIIYREKHLIHVVTSVTLRCYLCCCRAWN